MLYKPKYLNDKPLHIKREEAINMAKAGQESSLTRHIKRVHSKIEEFHCEQCLKNFGRKDNLMIHKKTVHGKLKDYQCLKCFEAVRKGK